MLTTILFGLGLVLLWRKPSWGRLVAFAALIFCVYAVLVWISIGSYLSAAEAPLDERWNSVLLRAVFWVGTFVTFGTVIIWIKRKRAAALS